MIRAQSILVGKPLDEAVTNCSVPVSTWLTQAASSQRASIGESASADVRIDLGDNHEAVFSPFSAANVLVLDAAARAVLDTVEQQRSHSNPFGIFNLGGEEAATIARRLQDLQMVQPLEWRTPAQARPHALSTWIHVTNACNLRCTYCYIDKTEQPMDEATGRAAVEAVFRSAVHNGFGAVSLKYAGGEATLHFGLVMKLHQHAANLATTTGLELQEAVLSNGVALTRPMIEFMVQQGMRLMISLDGIGATHDAHRVFANGQGSSRQVERAIDRAISLGLPPDLSITVTAANAEHLAEVVTFALDRNLRFNLNFYREGGTAASVGDFRAADEQIIAGVRAALAVIEERLPRYRLIDNLLDRSAFNQPHEFACGVGRSLLVIDQAGSVARCQMEIGEPITDVSVEDPLEVIQLQSAGFQSISVNDKVGCKDCTWRFWCAGGCPQLTYRATGRTDIQSPYCSVYKALFPELVRLEGLRLLKWGSDC